MSCLINSNLTKFILITSNAFHIFPLGTQRAIQSRVVIPLNPSHPSSLSLFFFFFLSSSTTIHLGHQANFLEINLSSSFPFNQQPTTNSSLHLNSLLPKPDMNPSNFFVSYMAITILQAIISSYLCCVATSVW